MPLFVFDFDGGTYISQVRAASWRSAPVVWAGKLTPGEVKGIGPSTLRELRDSMTELVPVALRGLHKAWCLTTSLRGRFALIHFVETNG